MVALPNWMIYVVIAIGLVLAALSLLPRLLKGYGDMSSKVSGGLSSDPGTDVTPGADYR